MSRIVIPVGCSIYSRVIQKFGIILEVKHEDNWGRIVIQYDDDTAFTSDVWDYEECIEDGSIIAFDKELTEQERLVAFLKYDL